MSSGEIEKFKESCDDAGEEISKEEAEELKYHSFSGDPNKNPTIRELPSTYPELEGHEVTVDGVRNALSESGIFDVVFDAACIFVDGKTYLTNTEHSDDFIKFFERLDLPVAVKNLPKGSDSDGGKVGISVGGFSPSVLPEEMRKKWLELSEKLESA